MTEVVYPDMETLLASKENFQFFHTGRHTKKMVSIGTRHNTYHLFMGEIAAEREGWVADQLIAATPAGYRQQFGCVVHPFQFHALLERERGCRKKRFDKVGAVG